MSWSDQTLTRAATSRNRASSFNMSKLFTCGSNCDFLSEAYPELRKNLAQLGIFERLAWSLLKPCTRSQPEVPQKKNIKQNSKTTANTNFVSNIFSLLGILLGRILFFSHKKSCVYTFSNWNLTETGRGGGLCILFIRTGPGFAFQSGEVQTRQQQDTSCRTENEVPRAQEKRLSVVLRKTCDTMLTGFTIYTSDLNAEDLQMASLTQDALRLKVFQAVKWLEFWKWRYPSFQLNVSLASQTENKAKISKLLTVERLRGLRPKSRCSVEL